MINIMGIPGKGLPIFGVGEEISKHAMQSPSSVCSAYWVLIDQDYCPSAAFFSFRPGVDPTN